VAKALIWLAAAFFAASSAGQPPPVLRWYKGNTHTHTNRSDGDSSPEEVVRWYREHQYDFVVITDHDKVIVIPDDDILVIPGEEVTSRLPGKPLHVNGIGLKKVVAPATGTSAVEILQRNVDAIREAGGIPQINHPNFGWSFGVDVLSGLRNVKLLEIASGHPFVNMDGGGGLPSVEAMWDELLAGGRTIYGVAVDDAHHLKFATTPGAAVIPGRGWIVVRAAERTVAAILAAIDRGDFYASTGVELTDYRADGTSVSVAIKEKNTARYRTRFIGRGGKVLEETIANPAVYAIRGDEGYVRARVIDSNGKCAWTQPVRLP
jgi:hypothetical protein